MKTKVYSSTVYSTRDSALVEAARVARKHGKATIWYMGYRQYTVTEYDPGDESKLEALRIVFRDGTSVDAVVYSKIEKQEELAK